MDFWKYFEFVSLSICTISILFCVYALYVAEARKRRRSLINYGRDKYEQAIYNTTDRMTADQERFQDLNHLLLVNQVESQQILTNVPNNSFFKALGMEVSEVKVIRNKIACLMPLNNRYKSVYEQMRQTCNKYGFNLTKSSDVNLSLDDLPRHIIQMILSAEVVIAVIDGRNPNVMYEIGIAHAVGKYVILVAKNEKAPFDINHQRLLLYRSLNDLDKKLVEYLTLIKKSR